MSRYAAEVRELRWPHVAVETWTWISVLQFWLTKGAPLYLRPPPSNTY